MRYVSLFTEGNATITLLDTFVMILSKTRLLKASLNVDRLTPIISANFISLGSLFLPADMRSMAWSSLAFTYTYSWDFFSKFPFFSLQSAINNHTLPSILFQALHRVFSYRERYLPKTLRHPRLKLGSLVSRPRGPSPDMVGSRCPIPLSSYSR